MTDAEAAGRAGEPELGTQVQRALRWSVANQIALRIASFASGIVLARILTPDDFGVFAVALASMTILVSLNDLGVILGLVRWKGDVAEVVPTAFTLAIGSSVLLWVGALLAAGPVANIMGNAQAENVIRVLSVVVLIDGVAAIPLGVVVRELRQDLMAKAELAAVPIGVAVSVVLALAGTGVWALAIGRIAGALVTGVLLVISSPVRPRFGWDPPIARHLMGFGLPLAGTTLVEELLLNLDYFIVGAVLGIEALGFYLLAFNLSNWPISIMKEGIRRVSIAGFSRLHGEPERRNEQFARAVGVLVTVALPMCLVLGILSEPLIHIVYGDKWAPSASALGVLAFLGLARVTVGLFFDLLIALGRSRVTFLLQLVWLLTLAPALYLVTTWTDTIRGPAVAHVVVAYGLIVPLYLLVLRSNGVPLGALARKSLAPAAASVLLAVLLVVDRAIFDRPLVELLGGGIAVLLYAVLVTPFAELRAWRTRRARSRTENQLATSSEAT